MRYQYKQLEKIREITGCINQVLPEILSNKKENIKQWIFYHNIVRDMPNSFHKEFQRAILETILKQKDPSRCSCDCHKWSGFFHCFSGPCCKNGDK